jgi:hypothetical protein
MEDGLSGPTPMASAPTVCLVEFNELCPALMARWTASGQLPNFRRLRDESRVYTTRTDEQPPDLEPWIQWVNVHSGLPLERHHIHYLGDGGRLEVPNVWDILSAAGYRVWVCGSMNAHYRPGLSGAFLPDPWATGVEPFPAALTPYFTLVRQFVMEHTRDRTPVGAAALARFVKFMATLGTSPRTVAAVARQLLTERVRGQRWKRAALLDQIQFEVFRAYYRRLRPHFSTFFSNSTAHYQHMYWRNMDPERFEIRPSAAEQAEYGDAILFGYQAMDRLLGRILDLVGPRATVLFCTALSQQPCLQYEASGGKRFYRPKDPGALFRLAGVRPDTATPVMSEEMHLAFAGREEAEAAATRLRALRAGGRPLMAADVSEGTVLTGCRIFEALPEDTMVDFGEGAPARRFFDLFYQVEAMKSGMHHRDGMLWIRSPEGRPRIHEGTVSLQAIAPTILEMFALPRPGHLAEEPLAGGEKPEPAEVSA